MTRKKSGMQCSEDGEWMSFESFMAKFHNVTDPGTKEDKNFCLLAYDWLNWGIAESTYNIVCCSLLNPCKLWQYSSLFTPTSVCCPPQPLHPLVAQLFVHSYHCLLLSPQPLHTLAAQLFVHAYQFMLLSSHPMHSLAELYTVHSSYQCLLLFPCSLWNTKSALWSTIRCPIAALSVSLLVVVPLLPDFSSAVLLAPVKSSIVIPLSCVACGVGITMSDDGKFSTCTCIHKLFF